jgi:hypothetical protein
MLAGLAQCYELGKGIIKARLLADHRLVLRRGATTVAETFNEIFSDEAKRDNIAKRSKGDRQCPQWVLQSYARV